MVEGLDLVARARRRWERATSISRGYLNVAHPA